MFATQIIAVVALALGVAAAPTAGSGQFKIAVTTKNAKNVYLTATGWTENQAQAIDCVLEADKILCGADKKGLTYGDMHTQVVLTPTTRAANNKGFSITPDNEIKWAAAKKGKFVHFSTYCDPFTGKACEPDTHIYAEICSSYGHGDGEGFKPATSVKAIFST